MPRSLSRLALAVALIGPLLLAGCTDTDSVDPPPILALERIHYWFEEDGLLVVNVTIRNEVNFTPAPPLTADPSVNVVMTEWRGLNDTDNGPGDDLNWETFHAMKFSFYSEIREPWRPRYFDNSINRTGPNAAFPGGVGPIKIHPNRTVSVEFAFLPENQYVDGDGYYQMEVFTWVSYPRTHPEFSLDSGRHSLWTGCFNYNVEEFYGVRQDGPDCMDYDSSGRPTDIMVARFGTEYTGEPVMIRGAPPGKNVDRWEGE